MSEIGLACDQDLEQPRPRGQVFRGPMDTAEYLRQVWEMTSMERLQLAREQWSQS
jgi:hypothetical protein